MRLLWIASLIALFGCTENDHWEEETIHAYQSAYNSRRLVYRPENQFQGMVLEFFYADHHLSAYLSLPFAYLPRPKNGSEVILKVSYGDQVESLIIHRHKGGQKFQIPEKALDRLVKIFENEREVTLSLSRISQVIQTHNFEKHLKQLRRRQLKFITI